MDDILSLLIPIIGFICIVFIVRVVVDGRVRRRLAETHASEELMRAMMEADARNQRQAALKWGLVLAASGIAFGIIDALGLTSADPGAYGLILGGAGLALLVHHLIQRHES